MSTHDSRYWDEVAHSWSKQRRQKLWRRFCDRVNTELIRSSVGAGAEGRALKTDLFDEASGSPGLIPELERGTAQTVGIDLSPVFIDRARASYPHFDATAADARQLPFRDRVFDVVLSNSTLDHMESLDDIETALGEIHRVLRPGGRLLLTLDNLANPVIALRAVLPHRLLTGLRLVPYYVGATCGPRRLRALTERSGLRVEEMGAMMHCPRLPAVVAAELLDRLPWAKLRRGFTDVLLWCEVLERLPTRYLTGYFLRLVAVRP